MDMAEAHHDILEFLSDHIGCDSTDILEPFGAKDRDVAKRALDELIEEGHIEGKLAYNEDGEFWVDLTLIAPSKADT